MSKTAGQRPQHRVVIWAFRRPLFTYVNFGAARPRTDHRAGIIIPYELMSQRLARGLFGSLPRNKLIRLGVTARVLKDKEPE